jgi:hypothetical protein
MIGNANMVSKVRPNASGEAAMCVQLKKAVRPTKVIENPCYTGVRP